MLQSASSHRPCESSSAHVFLELDLLVLLVLHRLLAFLECLFQGCKLEILLIVAFSALMQHILHGTSYAVCLIVTVQETSAIANKIYSQPTCSAVAAFLFSSQLQMLLEFLQLTQ